MGYQLLNEKCIGVQYKWTQIEEIAKMWSSCPNKWLSPSLQCVSILIIVIYYAPCVTNIIILTAFLLRLYAFPLQSQHLLISMM